MVAILQDGVQHLVPHEWAEEWFRADECDAIPAREPRAECNLSANPQLIGLEPVHGVKSSRTPAAAFHDFPPHAEFRWWCQWHGRRWEIRVIGDEGAPCDRDQDSDNAHPELHAVGLLHASLCNQVMQRRGKVQWRNVRESQRAGATARRYG